MLFRSSRASKENGRRPKNTPDQKASLPSPTVNPGACTHFRPRLLPNVSHSSTPPMIPRSFFWHLIAPSTTKIHRYHPPKSTTKKTPTPYLLCSLSLPWRSSSGTLSIIINHNRKGRINFLRWALLFNLQAATGSGGDSGGSEEANPDPLRYKSGHQAITLPHTQERTRYQRK